MCETTLFLLVLKKKQKQKTKKAPNAVVQGSCIFFLFLCSHLKTLSPLSQVFPLNHCPHQTADPTPRKLDSLQL